MDNSFGEPFIYITLKVSNEQMVLNVINNSSLELETQAKKIKGKGLDNSKSVLDLLYNDPIHSYNPDRKRRKKGK